MSKCVILFGSTVAVGLVATLIYFFLLKKTCESPLGPKPLTYAVQGAARAAPASGGGGIPASAIDVFLRDGDVPARRVQFASREGPAARMDGGLGDGLVPNGSGGGGDDDGDFNGMESGALYGGDAYDSLYPDENDPEISRDPRKVCGGCGSSQCAGSCGGVEDASLNLLSLMPGAWSKEAFGDDSGPLDASGGGSAGDADTRWTRYAPSLNSYRKYVTSAGSARLGLVSSTNSTRTIGIPNLLRSQPGTALSAAGPAVIFGDSSLRQDLVFNAVGSYPKDMSC
jgi:hypothetical protein